MSFAEESGISTFPVMKLGTRVLSLALLAVPALAVPAAAAAPAAAASVLVARYTFDAGATRDGRVAEQSGRGAPLTVRTADRGAVRFLAGRSGRYLSLPARCSANASTCPRALLQGTDDPDLDPGVRAFRWGATVNLTKAQLSGSPNLMQKGVATTESQWKMQIGETQGRAQCVVVGRGSNRKYVARSTVSVADGKWHKVLCTRSGTALTVHVDGTLRGRATVPSTMSISNDKPLRLGGPNFNKASDMYHGSLDDVYAQLG